MTNKSPTPSPLRPLGDWLQATAADLRRAEPAAADGTATLAAMQRALAGRPRAEGGSWLQRWRQALSWTRPLAWSGAASCAVLLLGATALLSLEPPAPPQELEAGDSGFVPLVSGERWASYLHEADGAPKASTAWVVATELPRERLALLGLPYDPAQAGDRVRAELLLHASGDVLAVRLVR